MMSPEPHFNAVANSDAELKDFKNMENLTEAAIVRLLFCLKRSAIRRSFLPQNTDRGGWDRRGGAHTVLRRGRVGAFVHKWRVLRNKATTLNVTSHGAPELVLVSQAPEKSCCFILKLRPDAPLCDPARLHNGR
jgi:hypothetical protein